MAEKPQFSNRLATETSPYLLQHAHNPVDWYPWGEEALTRAQDEDKPIFLSIGYAACHWCHVMERESFENEAIAAFLNEHFVCIKVDREERPDLDEMYMQAVVALTGQGGWPMSVWLTPDGRPFVAGTYFPPEDRVGRSGFMSILRRVVEQYRTHRDRIDGTAAQLTQFLQQDIDARLNGDLPADLLGIAQRDLLEQYDARHGGFGSEPKFPPAQSVELLCLHASLSGDENSRTAAVETLRQMAQGGIYDQIGGGFHRYSTDAEWYVPHFEKMLYDNALMARAYLSAYRLTGDVFHESMATEILDYVIREMQDDSGGYFSSTDADSEGEEGRFFTWTPEEVKQVLGEKTGSLVCDYYAITPEGYPAEGLGRSTGHSIPRMRMTLEAFAGTRDLSVTDLRQTIADSRAKLYAARESRVHPLKDDKILTAWNGLMIGAMAVAAQVTGLERFRHSAEHAAAFVLRDLRVDNRLRRSYRQGRARFDGCLQDYAFMIQGLLDLYELTFDQLWIDEARELNDYVIGHFWDEAGQSFFFTSDEHEELIARRKDYQDGALPSGTGVQALNMIRLSLLTGDSRARDRAEQTVQTYGKLLPEYPRAFLSLVTAASWLQDGGREVALVGTVDDAETQEMLRIARREFLPYSVVALADPTVDSHRRQALEAAVPLLAGKKPIDGQTTAYVCRQAVCREPVLSSEDFRRVLGV